MSGPTFTILLPIIRPPDMLPFAIGSILGQTRDDFELFIVGDGAPAETIEAAKAWADRDERIRVFPFAKGARRGESHRNVVLQEARGRYICQLADDDLWFPEHLQELETLLSEFEFGNLLHINVTEDDRLYIRLADLADPRVQARMTAEIFNFFGPSNSGYRMSAYRRLPVGWSPAPEDVPSDLNMWRKFLALPNIAAGTRFVITSLHFATPHRADWSRERRRQELARYAATVGTGVGRDQLRERALRGLAREHVARHEYILALLKRTEAKP